jgi:exodeoxyribonuclease VII large subunit
MKLQYEKVMTRKAFTNPMQRINDNYLLLDMKMKSIINSMKAKLVDSKNIFNKEITRLDTLSPLKTLSRGYGIVSKDEKVVKSVNDLEKDDKVILILSDGKKDAVIL